ncbi:unnamed protein product [Aphanomyces euteiches]
MTVTVSIVLGSVRAGRQGPRVAKYLETKFLAAGVKVHIIDPVDYDVPLLAGRYDWLPEDQKTDKFKALHAKLVESDAFVLVTPEYNHSYSPVLANLLDYFWHNEYFGKVAGIATYSMSGFGGVRAAGPLHTLIVGLGLVTIPRELPFPSVHTLLKEDGTLSAEAGSSGESLEGGAVKFAGELKWFAEALQAKRATGGLPAHHVEAHVVVGLTNVLHGSSGVTEDGASIDIPFIQAIIARNRPFVVLGTFRAGRQGSRVVKYLETKFLTAGTMVHVIDPVEYKVPVLAGRFGHLPEDQKTDVFKSLQAKFAEPDALVFVTPE